jgi:hypothetical protein
MEPRQNKQNTKYEDTTITADYILNLYKESKRIKNKKEQKAFIRDVKKLIPYIGQQVVIELEED